MGNVIDIFSRRPPQPAVDGEPTPRSAEKERPDQKRVDELSAVLENLTLEEAVKTWEKGSPKKLEAITFENAEYLAPVYVEKLIFEELSRILEKTGDFSDIKIKSLNNFVQLFDDYATKIKESTLMLESDYDPATMSERINGVENLIQRKKVELLAQELGPETVKMVKEIREFVDNGLASEGWQDELRKIHQGVHPTRSSGRDFLDRAAFVNSVSIDPVEGDNVSSLSDRRVSNDIKATIAAFGSQDGTPSRVNKSGNHFWNVAGQMQRDYEGEVRHLQALQDIDFVRDQLQRHCNESQVQSAREKIKTLTAKIS